MPDGAFVYALLAGNLPEALAKDQMSLHPTALDFRQGVKGVPQPEEKFLAIHEFLGTGFVQASRVFDPIITIQGVERLVVAYSFRMGGLTPLAGYEFLGHFIGNLYVFVMGVPRVKVFQIDGCQLYVLRSDGGVENGDLNGGGGERQ